MKQLPIEFLRQALDYDPVSGVLMWKCRPREHFSTDRGWRSFNSKHAGKSAGTFSKSTGYLIINFSGDLYGAHRIAMVLLSGVWPDHVDHIDGNRMNNIATNLRPCSKSENLCNRGKQTNNTSGFKGVHRHTDGRWRAKIHKNGKTTHLGLFATPDQAHMAYKSAAENLHGEFSNAGI